MRDRVVIKPNTPVAVAGSSLLISLTVSLPSVTPSRQQPRHVVTLYTTSDWTPDFYTTRDKEPKIGLSPSLA